MRVISGLYKGKKIESPESQEIRPTLDRVREAIFDVIQFRVNGAAALDLFSGTGAMGIEAASRGADVTFNDVFPSACIQIRKNCLNAGFVPKIFTMDYMSLLDMFALQNKEFDIIFIDPPYSGKSGETALKTVFERGILSSGGVAVFEHGTGIESDYDGIILADIKRKKYGKVIVDFLYKD